MFFPFFINSDLEENPLEQIEARAFNGLKHLQKLWVSANKRQTEVYTKKEVSSWNQNQSQLHSLLRDIGTIVNITWAIEN